MSVLGTGVRLLLTPDGAQVALRPLASGDAPGLYELYRRLPAADWARRLGVCDRHGRDAAVRAASVAERGGCGLVALAPPRRAVGEAHVDPLPGGNGRLMLVVAPEWRDWLGPRLFEGILDEAVAPGVRNVEVEVMRSDTWMLDLVTSYGHAVLPTDEWLAVRLAVGADGCTPLWDHRPGPRVLVETPTSQWHAAEAARKAGMTVMLCPRGGQRDAGCPLACGLPCALAAGADVVIVSYPPEAPAWDEQLRGHAQLHPGVPVLVEGRPPGTLPDGVVPLGTHDPAAIVDQVMRHAAARSAGPVGGPALISASGRGRRPGARPPAQPRPATRRRPARARRRR